LAGETEVLGENLPQCHFFRNKYYFNRSREKTHEVRQAKRTCSITLCCALRFLEGASDCTARLVLLPAGRMSRYLQMFCFLYLVVTGGIELCIFLKTRTTRIVQLGYRTYQTYTDTIMFIGYFA
jgi:hypothetical protein